MNKRVLVVDDNEDILKLVEKSLARLDLELKLFNNGLQALDEVANWHPDLAILDIMLPVIDGRELCRKIQTIDGLENLPVIFISAKTGVENRLSGYRSGGAHYLEKPFEVRELRAICTILLENQKIADLPPGIEIVRDILKYNGKEARLTPTEENIMMKLLAAGDTVVDKKNLGDKSLDTHISNLRKKLEPLGIQVLSHYGKGYHLEL